MSDLRLKNFKSHEVVREQNKRVQRKFDLTNDGRYNEFKFKLNGINTQQRIIEKDLERIRAGVHKPPNSAITTNHKSLSPPAAISLSERTLRNKLEKNSPKRSPRPVRKSEKVEIDTDMLVEYLQKLKDADVINIDNLINDKDIKSQQPANQKMNSDPEMYQRSDHQAERSGSLNSRRLDISTTKYVYSKSAESTDITGDLIHKTTSPNQRHLKSSPIAVMNASESESEKNQTNLSKKMCDAETKLPDKSNDQKKTKLSQEEFNGQDYSYDSFGYEDSTRNMNSDKQWEQARKARYVRTREPLERDRELSVKEIFEQK